MSKRTRYADNSRRQQPVQQQRAQAAQLAQQQKKSQPAGEASADAKSGDTKSSSR